MASPEHNYQSRFKPKVSLLNPDVQQWGPSMASGKLSVADLISLAAHVDRFPPGKKSQLGSHGLLFCWKTEGPGRERPYNASESVLVCPLMLTNKMTLKSGSMAKGRFVLHLTLYGSLNLEKTS